MSFIKKNKLLIFSSIGIIALYIVSRFYNIMTLPMFTDEAIYTRWSQIAKLDSAWRFISLTDGKQPMFVWFDMVFMHYITDPLLAGRLVSVAVGFGTMIGIFLLSNELFKNKKIALISALIYVIYPFSLVYDRMALYDSMVAFFAVWSLYVEILLVRKVRLDVALILGLVLGGALLTKSSASFFVYLLPFSLLLFDFNKKDRNKRLLKWIGFALIAVGLGYLYYSILRLSPFVHIINDKNALFVYPYSEWIQHPFRFFYGNLQGLMNWLLTYLTWPGFILAIAALVIEYKKHYREKILLAFWFLPAFLSLALFGKVLYPRFILFMTMPLIILVSFSLFWIMERFRNLALKTILFLVFALLMLRSDYFILTDFARAPIPFLDLEQYINGWPAGGGTNEIISYLEKEASKGKIYVLSEGTFGSLPTYAVEIYLGQNKNVEKNGIWPLKSEFAEDIGIRARTMPVYFIFNQSQIDRDNLPQKKWPMKLIAKYRKGIGDSHMALYQVIAK